MSKRTIFRATIAGILALSTAVLIPAAQAASGSPTVSDSALDLSVPDSPAFSALDLSPESVSRPSSPRELAASLLNGVDPRGNLQTGVAVDTAPYALLWGQNITLQDYQTHDFSGYLQRFSVRSLLSVATAKGVNTSDDKAVRLGVGFRFTPYDSGDPRNDDELTNCLVNALATVDLTQTNAKQKQKIRDADALEEKLKTLTGEAANEARAKLRALNSEIADLKKEADAALEKDSAPLIKRCNENTQFQSNLWNPTAWSLGVAPVFTSTTGNVDNLGNAGVSGWSSASYGFEGFPDIIRHHAQFIVSARYLQNEVIPDQTKKGSFIEQDMGLVGGRLRMGWTRIFLNLEGAWVHTDPKGVSNTDNSFRYSVGGDIALANNLWLTLSVGSNTGSGQNSSSFILSGLKYAIHSEPSIKLTKE